jgi:hypothetical protein
MKMLLDIVLQKVTSYVAKLLLRYTISGGHCYVDVWHQT